MTPAMMADLVVRNGTVIDGTGSAPFAADVAITDGKIADVGAIGTVACPELDAAGLYVAPGFIDIHSHSDYTLLVDPRAVSAIHQGVTLEVVGNCGFGCFPILDRELSPIAIYGYNGQIPIEWQNANGYFDRLDAARPAVNVISLVPNGQLRLAVLGRQLGRTNDDDLSRMVALLEESLEAGAWGYSTGLEYAQETETTEADIARLCEAVVARDGLYATHTRARDEGAADAVREALRVAERTNVRLQVSHLVPRSGPVEQERCVAVVERAQKQGVDVAFDMHTRPFALTYLHIALPAWALAASPEELRRLLRNRDTREKLKTYSSMLTAAGDWRRVMLLDNPIVPEYAFRDLAVISDERGQDPLDTIYDVLVEATDRLHDLLVIIESYTPDQQASVFAHPMCMPASDATTMAPDGPLADSIFYGAYTWASWFYHFMVQERKALDPAAAVHKLTGMPAQALGLKDRGICRRGMRADLTIFDPNTFSERGTRLKPNVLAEGVAHVLVNGVPTLSEGRLTGERAGVVIRR
jgi:N-acyl-D-amino-acid deacylase